MDNFRRWLNEAAPDHAYRRLAMTPRELKIAREAWEAAIASAKVTDERGAFEVWAASQGLHIQRDDPDDRLPATQWGWSAWQARATIAGVTEAQAPSMWREYELTVQGLAKLPEPGTELLLWAVEDYWDDEVHVITGQAHMGEVRADGEQRYLTDYMNTDRSVITHWMPLPAAPADGVKEAQAPQPVAYHDKDQPNGIAWCPGYPEGLRDITPLYAGEPAKVTRGALARGVDACAHDWSNVDSDGSVWPEADSICRKCGRRKGNAGVAIPHEAQGEKR